MQTNTFQIVIASDGYDSFVMMRYPDDGLNWIVSEGKQSPIFPDVPGQAGIDAGDGRRSSILPGSGSPQAANMAQCVLLILTFYKLYVVEFQLNVILELHQEFALVTILYLYLYT